MNQYPLATVACFDPTRGDLPRRQLDAQRLQQFLGRLGQAGAHSVLIGSSTGQGHLRTVDELREFFQAAAPAKTPDMTMMALLRPEDGIAVNEELLSELKELGYDFVFLRPGNDLDPNVTDQQVAESLRPLVQRASEVGLPLGLYSISDVSGFPLTARAVAMLVAGPGGENIVAVKVTEADYETSTRQFFEHPDLAHVKIVQGWDPHLARALQDGGQRSGVTSGPMSLAVFQYLHILDAASQGLWHEVELSQQAVTAVFQSMQDDPTKFADLQRAKHIMGLGHPICAEVTDDQVNRVLDALRNLSRHEDRDRMCRSLDLMGDGPYHKTLRQIGG